MSCPNLVNIAALISIISISSLVFADGNMYFYKIMRQKETESTEKPYLRNSRSPQHAGLGGVPIGQYQYPRFGWQNPILTAPTLPPVVIVQHKPNINPSLWDRPGNYGNPNLPNQYNPTPTPYYRNPSTTPFYRDTTSYPTTRRHFSQHQSTTPNPYYDPFTSPRNEYYTQGQSRTTTEKTEYERIPQTEAQTQERCPPRSRKGKINGKCYPLGSTEPCPENMAFYADPLNQEFGQCDCKQDYNRPLVYHPESNKCYFIFQQAYCEHGEWLILDPNRNDKPFCDTNRCISWTRNITSDWPWTLNNFELDTRGPVALLRERSCASLGWFCKGEGQDSIRSLLEHAPPLPGRLQSSQKIRLLFSGANLVCAREEDNKPSQFDESFLTIACKPGLINKWRLEGNCQ